MAAIFYNSYLLDRESLDDIDNLIAQGLIHSQLIGEQFSDKLAGDETLIKEAEDILAAASIYI